MSGRLIRLDCLFIGSPEKEDIDEDIKASFLKRVEVRDSGCWIWIGAKSTGKATPGRTPYGMAWTKLGRTPAHRLSWVIHNGDIPDGLFVCHHCDVPLCVNPSHLFVGTHDDNMADRLRKGRCYDGSKSALIQRSVTHCPKNHPYNTENTIITKKGGRVCRECNKARCAITNKRLRGN